jgi:hypothetical protein
MTMETREFITLDEIIGIEFKCANPKCKAAVSISLAKLTDERMVYACPSCTTHWANERSIRQHPLMIFVDSFRRLMNIKAGEPFAIRLEMKSKVSDEKHETGQRG